jgi:hypothetical protein
MQLDQYDAQGMFGDPTEVDSETFSTRGRVNNHIYYNILLSESRIPNISRIMALPPLAEPPPHPE